MRAERRCSESREALYCPQKELHFHGEAKKKKMVEMNLFTKQEERHRRRKQSYGHPGGGGRDRLETGVGTYTLLYIK